MPPEDLQPKSEYERIRDRNIQQRKEELQAAGILLEIENAKRALYPSDPSVDGGAKKRNNPLKESAPAKEPRRSARQRRPTNYTEEYQDDADYPAPAAVKKPRTKALKGNTFKTPAPSMDDSSKGSEAAFQEATSSGRRSMRPRKPVSYTEEQLPAHDEYIYCGTCKVDKFHGCEEHVPFFADFKDFTLRIEPSCVGKNAGDGVVNRGSLIKEGTLFGPYQGKFYSKEEYRGILKTNSESGNAWELKDSEGLVTIGFIDPGRDYDSTKNWMTKINCAKDSNSQNLVGFQLHGQIYYRVCKDIPIGKELLVWYGNEYAKDLGIDVAKTEYFRGVEFHKSEGFPCSNCGTVFATELALAQHKAKAADGPCFRRSRAKTKAIPCNKCPLTFPTQMAMLEHCMADHILPFPKGKPIGEKQCPWCLKHYSSRRQVLEHYGRKHCGHGRRDYKCGTCGREFNVKSNLTKHIRTVHEQQRRFSCDTCGKSFGQPAHLRYHVDCVHLKLKPYICGWDGCTEAFGLSFQRRAHQKDKHNGEWNFGCQVCEDFDGSWVGFNSRARLDAHMQRLHPEEWKQQQEAYLASHPYMCKVVKCGKRFETEVEASRHQTKIHNC